MHFCAFIMYGEVDMYSAVNAASLQLLPLVTIEDDDEIGQLVRAVRIVTYICSNAPT